MNSDVANDQCTTGRRQQLHTTATQTKVYTSTIERHIGSIRNALHLVSTNLLTQCIFQTLGVFLDISPCAKTRTKDEVVAGARGERRNLFRVSRVMYIISVRA